MQVSLFPQPQSMLPGSVWETGDYYYQRYNLGREHGSEVARWHVLQSVGGLSDVYGRPRGVWWQTHLAQVKQGELELQLN